MRNRTVRRVTGLVVFAGAIILGRSWLCDEHGTVQAQGTKCPRCAS
jgi:hypothetical protein